MFKSIDPEEDSALEGFKYYNKFGDEEYVEFSSGTVLVKDDSGQDIEIYVEDIPKLIKALQLAYDYKGA